MMLPVLCPGMFPPVQKDTSFSPTLSWLKLPTGEEKAKSKVET